MTEWSDAEISRRLALAIGWEEEHMEGSANGNGVLLPGSDGEVWRVFDYRDPAVIWPIAERLNLFPGKWGGSWEVCDDAGEETSADTAAKAVALAVIKAMEQT